MEIKEAFNAINHVTKTLNTTAASKSATAIESSPFRQ